MSRSIHGGAYPIGRLTSLFNLASGNLLLVITSVIAILTTRFVYRELGLGEWGNVTFLLSLAAVIMPISSALNSATGRFVTQSEECNEHVASSEYLTNALAMLVGVGAIAILTLLVIGSFWMDRGDIPIGVLVITLLATTLSCIGQILAVGTFTRRRFYLRDSLLAAGRFLNFLSMVYLLFRCDAGIWAIAWGLLVGGIFQCTSFFFVLRHLLPDVRVAVSFLNRDRVREIFGFCVWSIMAFCGGYLVRSGLLWAVKGTGSDAVLGQFAIATQVGTVVAQSIAAVTMLGVPVIYKMTATSRFREATHYMEKSIFMGATVGILLLTIFYFEGAQIVRLWLGADRDGGTSAAVEPILRCTVLSASITALGGIIGSFLVGCGRFRFCGIITLIEGATVLGVGWALLLWDPGLTALAALLPGLFSLGKQGFILKSEDCVKLSRARDFARGIFKLALVGVAVVGISFLMRSLLTGDDATRLFVRVGVTSFPCVFYLIRTYLRLNQTYTSTGP